MSSLILRATARYLLPLLLLFSIFLWGRGHNEVGGGFVAGLVAAAGYALLAIGYGPGTARRVLRIDPRLMIGIGLLLSFSSGLLGLFAGEPYLTGRWQSIKLPGFGETAIGTPLLFDLGVFLTVWGVMLTVIFALGEEE